MSSKQEFSKSINNTFVERFDEKIALGGLVKPIKNMISVEMPKYKCHKEVWALKINKIVKDGEGENRESDGSAIITPEEKGYGEIHVDFDYIRKHKPEVGGYYVQYKGGYESYSPAEDFESGYSLINN